MEKRIFKDKVYSILAKMIRAMANPRRLEIIDLLGQGEKSVEEIASETNMTVANASQHLQVLKAENLVEIRREKNFIHYRLAHEEIYKSWQNLRALGFERVAEIQKLVDDFREKKNGLEAINLDELLKRLKSKNIMLLDVRPEQEYNNGHIPKAINIPPDELLSRLKKLPKNKEYIAYCRGPFCVFADEAVSALSKRGFKARRLVEGFPDWKSRGLNVEVVHD
ncbi:metalloregulator ArsR/SmtB family transcription factor [Panacibacter ginsenosidivorans]|uniref:Metalloregulator ArsR/SmtB family transcription factor n=1 Tax=Panacibacter ginsenosidivorans TaxID=1813871 RepID=A0A5B8VDZ7_9BACT|nr:metalloregulator ArsR/SmtB family transcription factor [Panacibacter ginsenosidivorans]QEC69243.1 metalloregulator ArsR/SmtB family transcription factor [Panacibacter ginsenosidivorans]